MKETTISARYEVHARVAVITLDNPPVNGLGYATRRALVDGVDRANASSSVQRPVACGDFMPRSRFSRTVRPGKISRSSGT